MNIQTINNKHYIELDVVMLPTIKSKIHLSKVHNSKLLYESVEEFEQLDKDNYISQHLYFLSNEKSKEGDWCLNKLNEIIQFGKNYDVKFYKKIEATTDSSLGYEDSITIKQRKGLSNTYPTFKPISQIPQQFIEHFIPEFNKGNVIQKVKVEVNKVEGNCDCYYTKFCKAPEHLETKELCRDSDNYIIGVNQVNNEVIPLIDVLENTPFHKLDFSHLKVQTAVDWFANEIDNLLPYVNEKTSKQFNDLLEKAKTIQQQHIEHSFDAGVSSVLKNFDKAYSDVDGETYYKQNFK
jgi:hypothetical protein